MGKLVFLLIKIVRSDKSDETVSGTRLEKVFTVKSFRIDRVLMRLEKILGG